MVAAQPHIVKKSKAFLIMLQYRQFPLLTVVHLTLLVIQLLSTVLALGRQPKLLQSAVLVKSLVSQ
ncbi:MAG: hypothetical protein CML06_13790 [Pseudomonadales bacterium]|nr:hypothetical protein [Pseudomonadales bacterium]